MNGKIIEQSNDKGNAANALVRPKEDAGWAGIGSLQPADWLSEGCSSASGNRLDLQPTPVNSTHVHQNLMILPLKTR